MTLTSQLEALKKQKSSTLPNLRHGENVLNINLNRPESGEFSFLRRKLAQFRSGKWRRQAGTDNLIRSQSWNQGLQSPRNLQSEWSSSLTSLKEHEPSESCSSSKQDIISEETKPVDETDAPSGRQCKITRSQSVLVKGGSESDDVNFRRHSQLGSSVRLRKRPQSFAGPETCQGTSQFYTSLDNYGTLPGLTSAQSEDHLWSDHSVTCCLHHEFNRLPSRKTYHSSTAALSGSVSSKIYRRLSSQHEGRSRSLTHMDALEPGTVFKDIDKDTCSEPATLIVPPLQARRQKLARSQVSSSEYFSVSFDVGNSGDGDEFVVASKGTSLAEALNSICSKRGIDLTTVNVYLDSYKTPLPILTTETSWLGGKHIVVKGKDERITQKVPKTSTGQPSHSRKSSGSYRGRSGRFFSASTEEPSFAGSPDNSSSKSNKSKQRWSGLFGNFKDTKMEALAEQLNNYSKHGIPQLPNADEDLEEALYNLEEDWRDIVSNASSLTERVQQQQTAIWELIHTEIAYIHTLKVVTNLFLSCISNLQNSGLLTDVDKSRLFSNITEIYASNKLFWTRHILPMLAASRETGLTLNPQLLLDGFLKFDDIFRPYTKYCAEQSQCQQYCREKHQDSELFTAYLVWCETQKDCNRLRLMDILVKPMQRITKYSLLLKAIQKHTEIEDHRLSLDLMIRRVDLFVNSVNTTLRQKQDLEKIHAVIARIEAYDVVESKDEDLERLVRSYNDLDLTCPMPGCCNSQRRHLILEGDLKLKDNATSKVDVHCFLFTDMLLICKPATRRSEGRVRVLRQPYLVERLVVQELNRDPATLALVYLTEYRVPCGAFLLSSSDTKTVKTWSSSIRKAQDLYAAAKQATTATSHSILALSRQPSSYYEDDWTEETADDMDSHSVTSLGLFPAKSPRGSTRGSSLNHSHSGSVEMNEGSSVSSISQSRGISMENEVRGSSQSSDEGVPPLGADRPHHSTSPRGERRKCTSPNTLSIQVPVFSNLGQSLPDLNQVTCSSTNSSSGLLLVPPRGGTPHRGTSYPPPSPPLRRAPALTMSRNPPLLKTRHIGSSASTSIATTSCDVDIAVITNVHSEELGETNATSVQAQQRQALMKRLTRTDNKRYHTAGAIDDLKKQDKDTSIHKRLSWNCGAAVNANNEASSPSSSGIQRQIGGALSSDSIRSSSGVSSTGGSVASGLDADGNEGKGLVEAYNENILCCATPPTSPASPCVDAEMSPQCPESVTDSTNQLAELMLNDASLETSDV